MYMVNLIAMVEILDVDMHTDLGQRWDEVYNWVGSWIQPGSLGLVRIAEASEQFDVLVEVVSLSFLV